LVVSISRTSETSKTSELPKLVIDKPETDPKRNKLPDPSEFIKPTNK
ncbi:10741_t:CDS:1, partial [Dentiscutata heterogama]